jgi:hypothetical protein
MGGYTTEKMIQNKEVYDKEKLSYYGKHLFIQEYFTHPFIDMGVT